MKILLFCFSAFLSKSFSLEMSQFEPQNISLDELITSPKIYIKERSAVECGLKCHRNISCTAIDYVEANRSCTLIQLTKRSRGLTIAWASSVLNRNYASRVVDGSIKTNMFHSVHNGDKCAWLALDLLTPHEVSGVKLIERNDNYAYRSKNVEVRVGNEKPFDRNTNGNSMYATNQICGQIEKPGIPGGTTHLECKIPLQGRYVTLQRKEDGNVLNWMEVVIETNSLTSMESKITVLMDVKRRALLVPRCDHRVDYSECPANFPYAVRQGEICCSEADSTTNFDAPSCENGDPYECADKPCINYGCQPYSCYLQDMTITGGNR